MRLKPLILKIMIPVLIVSLLTGCMFKNKTDELVFTGNIEAEETDISSEVGGIITELFIVEGQKIKKGDKIACIDTKGLKLQLKQVKAGLKAAEAQLEELKAGARSEDINKAKANLENAKALLDGTKKNYDYRVQNFNKINELYKKSAAAKNQVDDAKFLVDSAYANMQSAKKQLEAARAQLDLLLKGPTEQKIKMADAEVKRLMAQIELLKHQISKGEIVSSIDGVIQNINYKKGELIPIGGKIATLVNLNNLWVKIYVPEKELHKVSLNQELELIVDYLNTEKVLGKVTFISEEAEFTPKNIESKESKEDMVFAVKVKIMNMLSFLKPGMLVDVKLDGDN